MNLVHVRITDFCKYPGGRYAKDGKYSGEDFRENYLKPAFEKAELVVVDLSGVPGFGSSFLEEAFGGLVRALDAEPKSVWDRLRLRVHPEDISTISDIRYYIEHAKTGRPK